MLQRWKRSDARGAKGRTGEGAGDEFLLSRDAFQRELARERMRSCRSGAGFAVLSLYLKANSVAPLAKTLAERIRLTDTAGYLGPGVVGVLLPETPEAGAWKLAEDLLGLLPQDYPAPWCEVAVHPHRPWEKNRPEDTPNTSSDDHRGRRFSDHPADEEKVAAGEFAADARETIATGSAGAVRRIDRRPEVVSAETLFLRPSPWWKRAIDIAGAGTGLFVFSPLMLGAAVAIKATSEGPIFYTQQREGRGPRPFAMYKFRTMVVDADEIKQRLMHLNEQDGPAFKIEHDPRVTRVGSILRKTSIDELPQLWNVLRGDMSLVGPRPLPVGESQACKDWQRQRLDVTPGLTCIWQIRDRRSKIPFADWVRLDMQYIESRSLLGDVKLILQTIATVLFRWRYR